MEKKPNSNAVIIAGAIVAAVVSGAYCWLAYKNGFTAQDVGQVITAVLAFVGGALAGRKS